MVDLGVEALLGKPCIVGCAHKGLIEGSTYIIKVWEILL